MGIFAEMALLAVTVTYVVDASGFTKSWRGAVARMLHSSEERLRPLPPFDCSTCAVWWACIILALCRHAFGLDTLAAAAGLSLLAMPAGMLMNAIRDTLNTIIGKI